VSHRSAPSAPLALAATLEAYLARPIGACFVGPTYAVFWRDPSLNGIVFWDRPDEADIRQAIPALDAELAPDVRPHASLIDGRRISAVDLGAFNTLSQYVGRRMEPFSRTITRQAVLRPDGLVGAAIAGFYSVLSANYPVDVFTKSAAALRWLGIGRPELVADEIDQFYALATCSSTLVVSLRAYLEERLGTASLDDSARALGMSARQLQRRLLEARTSFAQEVLAAKVRAAKTLLLETDYDVKRVAFEVGCASSQHFGFLFRKATGETPGEWRARRLQRGAGQLDRAH
jgi:AraC-like DNA-binding protein